MGSRSIGTTTRRTVTLVLLATLVAGACTGSDDASSPDTAATAPSDVATTDADTATTMPTTTEAPTTEPAPSTEPAPTSAPTTSDATTTTTTVAPTTTEAIEVTWTLIEGQAELPSGSIEVGDDDIYIRHTDGDLWLHRGLLGGTPDPPIRLVDYPDPRVEYDEGPGPNVVDHVAGEHDGAVYYGDCCEPVSGNLLAATGPHDGRVFVGFGYTPVFDPARERLATANNYVLTVIDLSTGDLLGRDLAPDDGFRDVWDLTWSADGDTIHMLVSDADGFAIVPFAAETPFAAGSPVSIGEPFSGSFDEVVRMAGRGPDGTIGVAVPGADATRIRYFDPNTLAERTELATELPATATSIRIGPDGVSLLWVEGDVLWYSSAQGDPVPLGDGIGAAWFAG